MRPEQAAEQPLNSSAFPLHQENGTLAREVQRNRHMLMLAHLPGRLQDK